MFTIIGSYQFKMSGEGNNNNSGGNVSASDGMKVLNELRVTELKQELEKRNLDKNGIKIILTDRLEKAIRSEGLDPATYKFNTNETVAEASQKSTASSLSSIESPSKKASSPAPSITPTTQLSMTESVGGEAATSEETKSDGDGDVTTAVQSAMSPKSVAEIKNETPDPVVPTASSGSDSAATAASVAVDTAAAAEPMDTSETSTGVIPSEAAGTESEELLEDPLNEPASATSEDAKKSVTSTTPAVASTDDRKAKEEHEREVAERSLWVRGLSISTKAADLKSLFLEHGKVVRAKIFTTKKQQATCFGYVTMADKETAEKCAQLLNRKQWKGRTITVEKGNKSRIPPMKAAAVVSLPPTRKEETSAAAPAPATTPATASTATSAAAATGSDKEKSAVGSSTGELTDRSKEKKETISAPSKTPVKDTSRKDPPRKSGSSSTKRPAAAPSSSKDKASRRDFDRNAVGSSSSTGAAKSSSDTRRRPVQRDTRHRESQKTISAPRRFPTAIASGHRPSQSYRMGLASSGRVTRPPPRQPARSFMSSVGGLSSASRRGESWDRREMMDLIRRQEEEHRRREMELELEREREKIRFEREKVEREKLEMQLQMALQQQQMVAMQQQNRKAAEFAVPAAVGGSSSSRNRGGAGSDSRSSRDRDRDARGKQSNVSGSRTASSRTVESSSSSRRSHGSSGGGGGGSSSTSSRHTANLADRITMPSSSGRSSDRSGRSGASHHNDRSRSRHDSYNSSSRHHHGGASSASNGSALYGSSSAGKEYDRNAYSTSTRDATGSSQLSGVYHTRPDSYSAGYVRESYSSSSRSGGSAATGAWTGSSSYSNGAGASGAWPSGTSSATTGGGMSWGNTGRTTATDGWSGFSGSSATGGGGSSSSSGLAGRVEYDKYQRRF